MGNAPTAPSTQGPDSTQQQQDPKPDPQPQPQQEPKKPQHEHYPDDHPLVRTLEAQKTEIRELKAKDAAKVATEVAAALKEHFVELYSISGEDAEVVLTSTDPAVLTKQVNRLIGLSAAGPRPHNNPVPREGDNPQSKPASDMREFTRNLFGSNE